MNNNLDIGKLTIPTTFDTDQKSWSLENSSQTTQKADISNDILNWLKTIECIKEPKMSLDDVEPNRGSLLDLQLRQINNQMRQLQLHQRTLQQLDETDEIQDTTAEINSELVTLQQQKEQIQEEKQHT